MKFEVFEQGKPKVTGCFLKCQSNSCIAFVLNVDTRNCCYSQYANNAIMILDDNSRTFTVVSFPDFADWEMWAYSPQKTNCQICLINPKGNCNESSN